MENTKELTEEQKLRSIITACRNAVGKCHIADVLPLMSVVNEKKEELKALQNSLQDEK